MKDDEHKYADGRAYTYGPDYDEDEPTRDFNLLGAIALICGIGAILMCALTTGPLEDKVKNLQAEVSSLEQSRDLTGEALTNLRLRQNQHFDYFAKKDQEIWRDLARLSHRKRVVVERHDYHFKKMADTYIDQSVKPLTPYENPQSH